jgi:hypothetical protein
MGSAARRRGAYGGEYMRAELRLRARGGRRKGSRSSQTRARKYYKRQRRRRLKTIFVFLRFKTFSRRSLSFIGGRATGSRTISYRVPIELWPWLARPPAGSISSSVDLLAWHARREERPAQAPSGLWRGVAWRGLLWRSPARGASGAAGPGGLAWRGLLWRSAGAAGPGAGRAGAAQPEPGARPSQRLPLFFSFLFAFSFLQFCLNGATK